MTQFEQIELLYKQFFNLSDEIKNTLGTENYFEVLEKLSFKEKLMKKIFMAKKTVDLTEQDKGKIEKIEAKIRKDSEETIKTLEALHREIGEQLNNTKNRVKMNSAYTIHSENESGKFIDFSE